MTSALFLGNTLCARKCRFALYFQVLSNQYAERSAYVNVFKFNREKKHFERAKVNYRCFDWFPAVMYGSLRGAPGGAFILGIPNTIIICWKVPTRPRVLNRKGLWGRESKSSLCSDPPLRVPCSTSQSPRTRFTFSDSPFRFYGKKKTVNLEKTQRERAFPHLLYSYRYSSFHVSTRMIGKSLYHLLFFHTIPVVIDETCSRLSWKLNETVLFTSRLSSALSK